MTSQQLVESGSSSQTTLDPISEAFSSEHWLLYFEENRAARVNIHFAQRVAVPQEVRTPLLRSLQRFQIGETGEGKHLKKFASTVNDPQYEKCIDLFIKEEQFHARVLAQMIECMDGTLLTWHWSELAFVVLRRMLGLKTEIFILLIAEIIGKCFYRVCADKLQDPKISDAFSLIVLDEIGHLEFHCSFMARQTANFPAWLRRAVLYCWSILFYTACFVFVADHRVTLAAIGVTPREFLPDCTRMFDRAAVRILPVGK
jgi:rubrerythrin